MDNVELPKYAISEVTEEDAARFSDIYYKEFGIKLSIAEAMELSRSLLRMVELVRNG